MISYLGDFKEDAIVYIMFNTFTSNDPSASCTITNFTSGDVHIHKDDGLAQRNNAAGITVSVDFDGITGSHMVKIDTSDDTVAGFWVVGHEYFVRIEGTTIDGATINSVVGQFSIENRFNEVDVVKISGDSTAADNLELDYDGTGFAKASSTIGTCTTNTDLVTAANVIDEFETQSQADPTGFHVNVKEVGGIAQTANDIGADINAILIDTNELQTDLANGGRLDLLIDRLLTATEIRQSSVNDPGGAATTTKFITALTETDNDFWNRMAVLFTSGNNSGQMRRIKDYNGGSKEITLQTPLNAIPANADTFIILTVRAFITPDIDDIADAVLDELTADHVGAGSLSKAISDILVDTSTTIPANITALNDITVADIIAGVADGSYDLQEMMRIMFAALSGKSSGGGTVTLKFRDSGDAKDRISATVDATGNRTAMTLDGS